MVSHVSWNNWSNRTHQLVTNKTKMASHRFITQPGDTLFKLFNHCWTLERVRKRFLLFERMILQEVANGVHFPLWETNPGRGRSGILLPYFCITFSTLLKEEGSVSWKLSNFKQWQLSPIWVKPKNNCSKHEKNVLKPQMHNTKGDREGQTSSTEKEDWNALQLWFLKTC